MIEIKNLGKTYHIGNISVYAVKDVSFKVKKGEFLGLTGKSGAGKSTLLYQMGLIDQPSHGEVIIDGIQTSNLTPEQRSQMRLNTLGYIFQDYALLPDLTAAENIALPLIMQGTSYKIALAKAYEKLQLVNLQGRKDNLPSELSGGEQQRVAICRAIVTNPKILFADEPTANLDTENGLNILQIFTKLHKMGQTIVMISHEAEYIKFVDRVITLKDGLIIKS